MSQLVCSGRGSVFIVLSYQKYSGCHDHFAACIPCILFLPGLLLPSESRPRYSTLWDKSRSQTLIHAVVSSTSFRFKTLIFLQEVCRSWHFGAVTMRKCSLSRQLRLSHSFICWIRFERTREVSKSEQSANRLAFTGGEDTPESPRNNVSEYRYLLLKARPSAIARIHVETLLGIRKLPTIISNANCLNSRIAELTPR